MRGSDSAGAGETGRPLQSVEPSRRTWLRAAAGESGGRGSAAAGASRPDPRAHRCAGDARAPGTLSPCGSRPPREAWRYPARADGGGEIGAGGNHRLQGLSPHPTPTSRSALPWAGGEGPGDPRGARAGRGGGGGGARSCGGRGLPPLFVQLESQPSPRE